MASVFLGDLSDYINPSQACVNPLFAEAGDNGSAAAAEAGSVHLVLDDGAMDMAVEVDTGIKPDLIKASGTNTAKVTLNDCLACSGCVTSAETVLISEQSIAKLRSSISSGSYEVVAMTIAPQVRASIAHRFGMRQQEVAERLVTFSQSIGVHHVLDSSIGGDVALAETRAELLHLLQHKKETAATGKAFWKAPPYTVAVSSTAQLDVSSGKEVPVPRLLSPAPAGPLLISACPGWVCYAEKTTPEAIPYMSTVKSPQQIMGSLVKRLLPGAAWGVSSTSAVLHITVMPCFDKKLEASRLDMMDAPTATRDVDLVITTTELVEMISEEAEKQGQIDHARLLQAAKTCSTGLTIARGMHPSKLMFSSMLNATSATAGDEATSISASLSQWGGSGGFLEDLFRFVAKHSYNADLSGCDLDYKGGRNPDVQEVSLAIDGKTVLKGALVYGFRNIQGLIMKLKRGRCDYDLVEVMACPGGCVNGGGQLKDEGETPKAMRVRVAAVGQVMRSEARPRAQGTEVSPVVRELFTRYFGGEPLSAKALELLHTTFHAVPKLEAANPMLASW